jgi:transcriptional regulator with XRE-family HTH domain
MDSSGYAIVERIDYLLAKRGQTRKALVAIGAVKSVTSLTDWLQRDTIPRADVALAIATYLGVSLQWLITGEDDQGFSLDERNVLVKYRMLTEENQRNIRVLIDSMLSVPSEGKKGALA